MACILGVGILLILGAEILRRSRRPEPAPETVQVEGYARLNAILTRVRTSPFGQSERGQRLTACIADYMARDAVIFTADIWWQALFRKEVFSPAVIYTRCYMLPSETFVFQTEDTMAESVYHEAVHALSVRTPASIEEECDGFAAGLQAAAALTSEVLPEVLLLDGMSLAELVARRYRGKTRDPDYEPVGLEIGGLLQIVGLTSIK